MGWGSGSAIMESIIQRLKPKRNKIYQGMFVLDAQDVYEVLIKEFEDADCDTLNECLGVDAIFDEVYHRLNPDEEDG